MPTGAPPHGPFTVVLLAVTVVLVAAGWTVQTRRARAMPGASSGRRVTIADPAVTQFVQRLEALSRLRLPVDPAGLARVKERTQSSEYALWLLGLDGVLVASWDQEDPHTLGYGSTAEVDLESHRKMLRVWWDVENRQDLIDILGRLAAGLHTTSYEQWVRAGSAAGSGIPAGMATGVHARATRQLVAETLPLVRGRGLVAWDYGRAVMLAKNGYLLGFLSEQETWGYLQHFGTELGARYGSWLDYGVSYVVGRAFWQSSMNQTIEPRDAVVQRLAESGAWSVVPWGGQPQGSAR